MTLPICNSAKISIKIFQCQLVRDKSSGDKAGAHPSAGRVKDGVEPGPASNLELVAALQIENFAGLVRGRDLKAEAFDDLAGK